MLKEPMQEAIARTECNGFLIKWYLYKTKYCNRCGNEERVIRASLVEYDFWFVEYCATCAKSNRISKTIHEKQTMPLCKECNTHFKFEGSEVLKHIHETLGHSVCKQCVKQFLKRIKRNHAGKDLSGKNEE